MGFHPPNGNGGINWEHFHKGGKLVDTQWPVLKNMYGDAWVESIDPKK